MMSNNCQVRKTLRISKKFDENIKDLKTKSPFVNESDFIRHLLTLGFNEYREGFE